MIIAGLCAEAALIRAIIAVPVRLIVASILVMLRDLIGLLIRINETGAPVGIGGRLLHRESHRRNGEQRRRKSECTKGKNFCRHDITPHTKTGGLAQADYATKAYTRGALKIQRLVPQIF